MNRFLSTTKQFSLFLGIVIMLIPSVSLALKAEDKKNFNKSIYYYNVDSCNTAETDAAGTDAASGNQAGSIYWLGDSITEGAYFDGGRYLEKELDKISSNVTVNASTGRSIDGAGTTRDKTSGLNAIKGELDRSSILDAETIVIALGTNDGPAGLKANIKKLIGDIKDIKKGAEKQTQIYWVNVFSEGGSNGYDLIKRTEINQAIDSLAADLNYKVIDPTKKAGGGAVDITLGDSVHPTAAGYKAYSEAIAANLNSIPSTDTPETAGLGCSCGEGIGPSAGTLPDTIPAYWRNLINDAKAKYKDVDERVVAAVLWIENRGWPDPKKDWATSSAGAKGPFQFIDTTWDSMGKDGDGDGVKDPNNPKDAVLAAFEHHRGSAGKPLMVGYKNNPEEAFKTLKFQREDNNLLYYIAKYNGDDSSSVEGGTLSSFPRGQNGDYVQMGFWLLATNFLKGWDPAAQKTVSASDSGKPAPGEAGGSLVLDCSDKDKAGVGQTVGNVSWPVDIKFWKADRSSFIATHHDYAAVDIEVPTGTEVFSILSGTVASVTSGGGCGNGVFIRSPGNIEIGYCHGEAGGVKVSAGQKVESGKLIMISDNSGSSTGAHLHVQIKINGTKHCPQQIFTDLAAGRQPTIENLVTTGCWHH